MKKMMIIIFGLAMVLSVAGSALAIPFQIDGGSLDVAFTHKIGTGNFSYEANGAGPFMLDEGQSANVTFGRLFLPKILGRGTMTFGVDFLSPYFGSPVEQSANFWMINFFIGTLGSLDFEAPRQFAYEYMGDTGGIMLLSFNDLSGITRNSWVDITGTITNLSNPLVDDGGNGEIPGTAPVPEPATLLLLGTGLIGLVAFGRKKMAKKN